MHYERLSADELVTRLAAVVDSCDEAIIGRDEHGTVTSWNSAATRLFGYKPEEILGQSILLLVPPLLHGEENEKLERIRRGERIETYETQCLRKGGARVAISAKVSPIKHPDGQIIGSAVFIRELSVQDRLHADRARLAAIVESSDDPIIGENLNGVITDWNAAAERMFGYTASEIIGNSILTLVPPELQHEEPLILSQIREGARIEHHETERLHKSGRRLEVSLSLSPIRDSSGRVVGASKIVRDVSERRRSERARLMLAAIVESSDDAIASKNLDGIITSWNAAAERLFGYTPDEIIGQSVLRLIPRELHYEEPRIIAKLRAGERIEHFETRRMRKNGEIFDVSLTVSPIRAADGTIIGASKIVRDISELKSAQTALIEKERMAAAGRMAATLAHEVNNPLEAITNLAYLLNQHPTLDSVAREYSQMLLNEVQRAGEITRQTLSFYRDSRMTVDIDIRQVVEHVVRWKTSKIHAKDVKVLMEFAEVPTIKGFAGEIRQVFENLIENALDAVKPGGNIRIRGRRVGTSGNERVAIAVCDNGTGMSQQVKSKIFDPFFTTKFQSGNGLGLWVSRGIVRKHGGTIRVRTSERWRKHGTVFTVTLPVSSSQQSVKTESNSSVQIA